MVTEFFGYAVQAILYSRALYPDTSFAQEQKYGLSLMITTEESVKSFIDNILKQLHLWLLQKQANKLILAVKDVETDEVIETWRFDVDSASEREEEEVDIVKIRQGIQNLMRQIISSVAFLPIPDGDVRRSFDLLVYTSKDVETPPLWCETGPQLVTHKNREEVRLPGFSTGIHKVDAAVAYKVELS
jgi:mitotic spindle assembly checkpoint protein MAD2